MHYVKNDFTEKLMSIGDVALATGISVYKLRIWERRYDFPEPIKLPSGHRRYASHTVDHLRLVKIALDSGIRISKVAKMSISEIVEVVKGIKGPTASEEIEFQKIVSKLRLWDEESILEIFERDWQKDGPIGFIKNSAATLTARVGEEWAKGSLSIAEEHFVSEILSKFLSAKWSEANQKLAGRPLMLTTLEGESHSFGIQFCAVTATHANVKVVNLGPSLPIHEIANACESGVSSGLCVSISSYFSPVKALEMLKALRTLVPSHLPIVIGGDGAPQGVEGVVTIKDVSDFYDWAQENAKPSITAL